MTWFWWNIAIIASCIVAAPLQLMFTNTPIDAGQGSWLFPLEIAGLCLFAVTCLIGLQALNPWAAGRWMRPTLYARPIGFDRPIQNFYMGGLCMIAAGFGYLVLGIFDAKARWMWAPPLSAGAGTWLGVELSVWGFPNRFEPKADPAQR